MAFKINIDGKILNIRDGFTIKEEYNETLDSGTVQFTLYGESLNKEPFDHVKIYDTESSIEDKYMLLDSFDEDIYSYNDDGNFDDYEYTMTIFSATKELERITLPNCSVTQPTEASGLSKRNVWQEIERFCSFYLPQIKVYRDTTIEKRYEIIDIPFESGSISATMNLKSLGYIQGLNVNDIDLSSIRIEGQHPMISISFFAPPEIVGDDLKIVFQRAIIGGPEILYRLQISFDYDTHFNFEYKPCYEFDPSVKTRFQRITCPEYQWNNPTLREVLTDLMSSDDCIPVIRRNVISFFDITQKGNPIDKTKLSRIKKSQNSADYASELTIQMKNAISNSSTKTPKYHTLRSITESARIDTNNMGIVVRHPIYSIKKFRIFRAYRFGKQVGSATTYFCRISEADITDRILEKQEFDLLSDVQITTNGSGAYGSLPIFKDKLGYDFPRHKVFFLYYERGNNKIFNFGTLYSRSDGTSQNFVSLYLNFQMSNLNGTTYYIGNAQKFSDWMYEIEYETEAESAISAGKYLPNNHPENRVFDNQSNSYVDIDHQSLLEYAKVNRLGNKVFEIYGEYTSESDIPQLGDYIDDAILFSKEITYFDNIILFKGLMTDHYILRNYFTGILSKKRSWQLANAKEALTRHDILKYYVEASTILKNDRIDSIVKNKLDSKGLIYYLTSFYKNSDEVDEELYKMNTVGIQTQKITSLDEKIFPKNLFYVNIDSQLSNAGMSLLYNFGFNDNIKMYDYSVPEGSEVITHFEPYCDEYGEFNKYKISLSANDLEREVYYPKPYKIIEFHRGSPVPADQDPQYTIVEDGEEIQDNVNPKQEVLDILTDAREIPLQKLQADKSFLFEFDFEKDNREIVQSSLQFEYCSDTKDIVVTNNLVKLCRANNSDLKTFEDGFDFYVSDNEEYTLNDKIAKGEIVSGATITFTEVGLNSVKIHFGKTFSSSDSHKSFAIADKQGNLIIGINETQEGSINKNIYFNLLKSRDTNIYSDYFNREIVGTIANNSQELSISHSNLVMIRPEMIKIIHNRNVQLSQTINVKKKII